MNLTQSDELIRKKIHAILGTDKQLISKAQVRIYTSTSESENNENNLIQHNDEWLYSNLEGIFCYVLDFQKKCRYFRLYENTSFQLLFHMDIYQNFSSFYTVVDPLFHCFEVNNIFIGLKFEDPNVANNFYLMINKLNDQIVKMMLDSESIKVKESKKERKKKFYENCDILKKNFGGENKYNKDYCEDGAQICKPSFYDLLNFMSYNRETKEFEVGAVPKEFRNLFKNMGIKKHQLKRADTTLTFFKYFIEQMDVLETVDRRKISNVSDFDEEDEKTEDSNSVNDLETKNSTLYSDNASLFGESSNSLMSNKNEINNLNNSNNKGTSLDVNVKNNNINNNFININKGSAANTTNFSNSNASVNSNNNNQQKEINHKSVIPPVPSIPNIPKPLSIPLAPPINKNIPIPPPIKNIPIAPPLNKDIGNTNNQLNVNKLLKIALNILFNFLFFLINE